MKRAIVFFLLSIIGFAASAQNTEETIIRRIDDLRRGEYATIRGEVVRYRDEDEILLRDESGRIEVYVGNGSRSAPPVDVGETIIVSGRVDDDLFAFSRELYATEIIRADGTTIELLPQRWE